MTKKRHHTHLKLLLAEVMLHMNLVRAHLMNPTPKTEENIKNKAAYITSLAMVIQNECLSLAAGQNLDDQKRRLQGSLAAIAYRLDRISELALNVVRQSDYLSRPDFLETYELDDFFDDIELGLGKIWPTLEQCKIKMSMRICQMEERLDDLYADRFAKIIDKLKENGPPGDLVTALMIVHYLERIGDMILEIGEEIIYVILGEKLRYDQLQALNAGLRAAGRDQNPDTLEFQSIWSGRSGCRIGVVGCGDSQDQAVIFKHGPAGKLKKEKDNLILWGNMKPGLSPAIKAFIPSQTGDKAGLMMEYMPGLTLKDMFLHHPPKSVFKSLANVLNFMAGLWVETKIEKPAKAEFAKQAENRLGSLLALYPTVIKYHGSFGPVCIKPISRLLAEARKLETRLQAPFSVRIHGDFNLSNIIYDLKNEHFHFIDLYRSRLSDYMQDASVMILSILRLSMAGPAARANLAGAAGMVLNFIRNFASTNGDQTANARLAFGLARSYLTSARFEPRKSSAIRLISRSRYLWEQLLDHGQSGQNWSDFKFDDRALYF